MSQGPFLSLILVFGYLQTGYWLAKLSWKVWHERETPGVLGYILFPLSAATKVGYGPGTTAAPIHEFSDHERYELWMAVCWPLKVSWNAMALIILGLFGICLGASATLKLLVFGPEQLVRWMSAVARRDHMRSLGGIGGTLPVAVPQANPATATRSG